MLPLTMYNTFSVQLSVYLSILFLLTVLSYMIYFRCLPLEKYSNHKTCCFLNVLASHHVALFYTKSSLRSWRDS